MKAVIKSSATAASRHTLSPSLPSSIFARAGIVAVALALIVGLAPAQAGESPALGTNRITQADIVGGNLSLKKIRAAGLKIFSTPFNKLDGYGDDPVMNPSDPTTPGARPTLQNNGTFLRVNGLDSQTCMECHSVGSFATAPFTFAIGGVGGSNNNAFVKPTEIDVDDTGGNNFAFYNGRYINPPFLFGSGGVELLGKEMTTELQAIKAQAQADPGNPYPLITKGVDFGTIVYTGGAFDTTNVQGIDDDLVVRPFGRKGNFATVRAFDVDATQFHLGMQSVELVGAGIDADNDGVVNELLIGEISALHIFNTNLEPPRQEKGGPAALQGENLFNSVGCTDCHRPFLDAASSHLTYSFPEVETDPTANVFYATNLRSAPTRFRPRPGGGIRVPLFSDLKRHDMGPGLAESFGDPLDSQFITPRLWGIADTAPYLHDGRALTLTDAILLHGGEAQTVRDNFANLGNGQKVKVLSFLRTLRTPRKPARDIVDY